MSGQLLDVQLKAILTCDKCQRGRVHETEHHSAARSETVLGTAGPEITRDVREIKEW